MMESNFIQDISALKKLPKSWNVFDFGNVFTDISGGNKKFLKSDFLVEGKIAIIDQGKDLIAGYTNEENEIVKGQPPYIVFGDHTRIFKFIDFPFVMGADGTKVFKVKDFTISNEKYLFHFLNSLNIPNTGYNRHFKYLKSTKIPLPPLPQQQKIANILDAAVTLKQNDKALIAKYDALTQALFLEMFGDPVRNPKGWEKVELKNLTQPIKKLGKDYKSPSINYVDISSIDNTKFLIVSTTEYLFEERPSRAQQILKKNDVLLSTVRPNLKNIAINKTDDLIASTGFYVCRVNEQLNSKFLFEVLKSDSVTNHFVGITAGANYPAVKSSDISKFQVVLPPIELQNQFAERVALIEEQKAIAQKSLEKSEALCNSLLQKAFNGGLT